MQKRVGTPVVLLSDSGKPLIREMSKGPELLRRRATQMPEDTEHSFQTKEHVQTSWVRGCLAHVGTDGRRESRRPSQLLS